MEAALTGIRPFTPSFSRDAHFHCPTLACRVTSPHLSNTPPPQLSGVPEVTEVEELTQETRLVPKEVWEDEPVERTEYRIVTEERKIPQVKALYPFQGQDMQVVKGEVRC